MLSLGGSKELANHHVKIINYASNLSVVLRSFMGTWPTSTDTDARGLQERMMSFSYSEVASYHWKIRVVLLSSDERQSHAF